MDSTGQNNGISELLEKCLRIKLMLGEQGQPSHQFETQGVA